jgi:hypothetical protein
MPTARELLEQADVLMRRNRLGVPGETVGRSATPAGPPSTLSRTGPALSPRTIQREPIAPSVARTSLPVDPTESPAFAVPDQQPVPFPVPPPDAQPAPESEPEFPLLTDAVDEAPAAVAPLDDLADDVPVLTDAVEEIDVGIVDEAARGDPSFWELTATGETSVLGPAPDSVVVVPPPLVPQAPPQGRDPLGLDQPPPGYPSSAEPTSVAAPEPYERAEVTPLADESSADPRGFGSESVSRIEPTIEPDAPLSTSTSDEPHPVAEDEPQLAVSVPAATPEDAAEEVIAAEPPGGEQPIAAEAQWTESPVESVATEPTLPPLPRVSDLDQQRVREIAEEIGMQVLQRIDIFTDTTLRARLGERLRPVVDRAAADLVAAINEHLGELLRAQISEAIEREIESWKNR